MPLDVNGFGDLMTDIAGMASNMDADGAGAPVAKRILEAAAVLIHEQMKSRRRKRPCSEVSRVIGAQIFSCISSIRSACAAVGHGHPAGHSGMKDAVVVPDACLAGPQDDRPVQAGLQCFGADFEHAAVVARAVLPGGKRRSACVAALKHRPVCSVVVGRKQKQGWIQVS